MAKLVFAREEVANWSPLEDPERLSVLSKDAALSKYALKNHLALVAMLKNKIDISSLIKLSKKNTHMKGN